MRSVPERGVQAIGSGVVRELEAPRQRVRFYQGHQVVVKSVVKQVNRPMPGQTPPHLVVLKLTFNLPSMHIQAAPSVVKCQLKLLDNKVRGTGCR